MQTILLCIIATTSISLIACIAIIVYTFKDKKKLDLGLDKALTDKKELYQKLHDATSELKELIFKRIRRINNNSQNIGLGLAVVKAIADYFNWECGFDSKEGKGSRFWIKAHINMKG